MNAPSEYGGLSAAEQPALAFSIARYVLAFVVSFLISLLLTPVIRWLARRTGMVDQPDARRIHAVPIPRGGGLAVFAAFHLTLFYMVLAGGAGYSPYFPESWRYLFLSVSTLLVAIGILDDKFGLKPWFKLAGQVAVAALLCANGLSFSAYFSSTLPAWMNHVVTIFWIVGVINAFNLIDGLDGLAAGLALIASLGLASTMFFREMSGAAIPFLALGGACLGFLRYNFHPASVFLGDTGSMFLGLTLAVLPLMTASKQELVASLGVPLIVMGIPIFDTMIAIWRRSMRAALPGTAALGSHRLRLMQADKEHLHHRVLAKTMSQRRAAVVLYVANILLVAVGLAAMLLGRRAPGVYLAAFVVAAFVIVRHLTQTELWDTGRVLLSRSRTTLSSRLVVPAYMCVDILLLSLAWYVSRLLADLPITRHEVKFHLPVFVAPVFVMLALARVYIRVWSRALLREYALIGVTVVAGVLLAAAIVILSDMAEEGWMRAAFLYLVIAQTLTVGVRLVGETLRESLSVVERLRLLDRPDAVRVLACGGGERFRLFLRERRTQTGRNTRVVVGVLDDDPNLRGRLVLGHPVLGALEELPAIVRERRIQEVIITARLPDDRRNELQALALAAGVPLLEWEYAERRLA
jgi:UDP-N-acetylmuramyl pentapeptide phosphotransferase/UDP-N-acetylglucosamine-1-phosphate transferase